MNAKYLKNQCEMTKENLKEMEDPGIRAAHKSRMLEAMSYFEKFTNKKQKVLDIGCRNGDFLFELQLRKYLNLQGIDCSEEAVKIATDKGFNCVVGDAHDLSRFKSKTFGTVVMSHVLEHCLEPHVVLSEVARVLKKDGVILLELPIEPKPESIPTKWSHYYTFQSEQELYTLLKTPIDFSDTFQVIDLLKDSRPNKFKWIRAVIKKIK